MSSCACPFCGAPIGGADKPVRPHCSAGCALRAAIPIDKDGNFPTNGALAHVLVFGFLLFNQGVTALAGILLGGSNSAWASVSNAASWVIAGIVALYGAMLQWAYAAQRPREVVILMCVLLSHSAVVFAPSPWTLPLSHFGVNVLYAAWIFRGPFRHRSFAGNSGNDSIPKRSDSV